jgi:hypothetical protein
MRLAAGATVPSHSDTKYHWYNRIRLHIPVITNPNVRFFCGDKQTHMAAGEAWIFDTWKAHRVENQSSEDRIHLVADTSGSAAFWDLVGRSDASGMPGAAETVASAAYLHYKPGNEVEVLTEKFNAPQVMSPGEVDGLIADLVDELRASSGLDHHAVDRFIQAVNDFRFEWRTIWSVHGPESSGWPKYQRLIQVTSERVAQIPVPLVLASNSVPAVNVLHQRILGWALNPSICQGSPAPLRQSAVPATAARPATGSPATAQPGSVKVGRNQPCPCGSGRKYKHCHG